MRLDEFEETMERPMGYTHRWSLAVRSINAAAYKRAVLDAKMVLVATLAQYRLRIDEDADVVRVDGPADATCETFVFYATRRAMEVAVVERRAELSRQFPRWSRAEVLSQARFDFVKTNRESYDDVVTACLCVLAEAGLPIGSDGWREEWEAGRRLASDVLGRAVNIPASIEAKNKEEHAA